MAGLATASIYRPPGACLVVLLLAGLAGCSPTNALSDYERSIKKKEDAESSLRDLGGKAAVRAYPPHGDAWCVELRGLTINDAVIDDLKKLGRITELDFSKSTINDDQMARLNELGLCKLLLKLDLSHTGVTDAGFDKLDKLYLLRDLNLTGTKITSAAVNRFLQNRRNDPKVAALFKSPAIRR